MNTFNAITVDKLELCFRGNVDLHEWMQGGRDITRDNFRLHLSVDSYSRVKYNVVYIGDDYTIADRNIGSLMIKLEKSYMNDNFRYFWFEFYNKALYSLDNQSDLGCIIQMFAAEMSLELNNITNFELAFDAEENLGSMLNMAYESDLMQPIVAGKAYKEDEYIPNVTRECWGSKKKAMLIHWRIKSYSSNFQMYCYDKLQEISAHDKDYIREYYHKDNFSSFWRLEIRADKKAIIDFLNPRRCTWEDFLLNYLFNDTGKEALMEYFSGRLLRFKFGRKGTYTSYSWLKGHLQ